MTNPTPEMLKAAVEVVSKLPELCDSEDHENAAWDILTAALAVNARTTELEPINIVFDGPPSHESGRFVEVEDDEGRGMSVGVWSERPDGLWALRIERDRRRGFLDLEGIQTKFAAVEVLSDRLLAERDKEPIRDRRRASPDYNAGYRMAMEDAARITRAAGPASACSTCNGTEMVHQEGQVGVPGSGGDLPCPDCVDRRLLSGRMTSNEDLQRMRQPDFG